MAKKKKGQSNNKIKGKSFEKNIVKRDITSVGTLGQIGVPAAVVDTPINTLPGQPFATPQTSISYWPAPNLWYAQGRQAAKKAYYEYIGLLNQMFACPNDQPDRRLALAGQLNSNVTSQIQGVTIGLEAEENAARRARMGDQAGALEKDVIHDTLDKILKLIWAHDTAAYSQQFPGMDVKLIENSITGRLNRVNHDKAVDVGVPLLSVQEAETLWMDDPLSPPLDEQEVTDNQPGNAEAQTSDDIMPTDEAPPAENEATNALSDETDRNTFEADNPENPEDNTLELDESTFGEMPSSEPPPEELATETEENPEEEEINMAGPNHDLKVAWVNFIDENPEKAAELLEQVQGGEEEAPLEESTEESPGDEGVEIEEEPSDDEGVEIEDEAPEENIPAEGDEEVEIEDEEPPMKEETVEETEETPEGEVDVEETQEMPEEGETVYCIQCDKDVDEEEIRRCKHPDCPFKQEAVETTEETPEKVEEDETIPKHFVFLNHEDHSGCNVHHIKIKDFTGVEGDYCLEHGIISYEFEPKVFSAVDAKNWVQKQMNINRIKNKSAEEIVTEKIDTLDEMTLKAFLNVDEESSEEEGFEVDLESFESVIERASKKILDPLESRIKRLEA